MTWVLAAADRMSEAKGSIRSGCNDDSGSFNTINDGNCRPKSAAAQSKNLKVPSDSSAASKGRVKPGCLPCGIHHRYRGSAESLGDCIAKVIGTFARAGLNDRLNRSCEIVAIVGQRRCAGAHLRSSSWRVGIGTKAIVEAPATQPISNSGQLRELSRVSEFCQNAAIGLQPPCQLIEDRSRVAAHFSKWAPSARQRRCRTKSRSSEYGFGFDLWIPVEH